MFSLHIAAAQGTTQEGQVHGAQTATCQGFYQAGDAKATAQRARSKEGGSRTPPARVLASSSRPEFSQDLTEQ